MMKYFPPFRFDRRTGLLFRGGVPVPISRKAADLLQCLLVSPGALVTHHDILQTVWPDTHVQPDNVKTVVHELRSALGDSVQHPRFIRSDPGRGYTFIADVADAMPPLFSDPEPGHVPPLVGRGAELDVIDGRVAAAASSCEPQLVIVEGDRGFGKTVLCDAVARRVRERWAIRISYATTVEARELALPYAPFVDAFALLARQYPQLVAPAFARRAPGWWPKVSGWEPPHAREIDPAWDTPTEERLLRELVAVLDELALDVPLLLFLEDLQWADAGTVDCLRHFARGHFPGRVCLVATYAESASTPAVDALKRLGRDLHSRAFAFIKLRPLMLDELNQWLERQFGGAVAGAIATPLFRAGGGNPLFAAMTMDCLVRKGEVKSTDGEWQVTSREDDPDRLLAAAVADSLRCQIDRLAPEDRVLLEAAATSGQEITAEAIASSLGMGGPSAIHRRLESLAARHLLLESSEHDRVGVAGAKPGFRFRHPLTASLLMDGGAPPN
jgi:DNA-binding winged helix-turn-helix (wHTH) protein